MFWCIVGKNGNKSIILWTREFSAQNSDWVIYKRRLDNYFLVNAIQDEGKKRAILLNALDEEAYKLINNLCFPRSPENKSYLELAELFNRYFKVAESPFVARANFFAAFKTHHESANEWAARVRSLALNCDFKEGEIDMMLRDRFVIGFEKGPIQAKLFKEKITCSFADIIEVAVAEMAAAETSGFKEPFIKMEPAVNHVTSRSKRQTSTSSAQTSRIMVSEKCACCGRNNHPTNKCRFRDYVCNQCKVKGHLAPVCPKKKDNRLSHRPKQKYVQNFIECQEIFSITETKQISKPFLVNIKIDNDLFTFQLDSGAGISAISENFWRNHFSHYKLLSPDKNLNVYNGETMLTLGMCKFKISYNNVSKYLNIFVIKNGGPPILGRDFMQLYNFNVCQVNFSSESNNIDYLLNKYNEVFSPGLGTFNKGTVSLKLKDDTVTPKFIRARPLPFGIRDKVEEEINNLVKLNVLKPVDYSPWATPIVPVIKKSGAVRICGDFKITINPVLEIDQFPLPRIDDLFSRLQGGVIFSKIDLSQAYAQICLDEKSKVLVTISTHKGLFQYQRLPYGVACAPSKFQKIMESLIQDIEGCVCFLDDILICGRNCDEHWTRLERVICRLQNAGLKVEPEKCSFLQTKISYLGYIIDKEGLHTSPDKVLAIKDAPTPTSVKQLQSVLGTINYYGKFIPNLATLLNPLYELLKKDMKWSWTKKCDDAFNKVKNILMSADVLVHYNPEYEIRLTTDASPYGIGCVLSHVLPDGQEKPIAYASRTLSPAERNYSQVEREGLSIIFALCKYNQFLYNQEFTLVTDNKPLLAIFNPKKGIPQYSANRLRRWAVILSNYRYKVKYVKSEKNTADFLSRLPVQDDENAIWQSVDVDYLNYFSDNDIISTNFDVIKKFTNLDSVLKSVMKFVKTGWPKNCKNNVKFKQFYMIRHELTVEHSVLIWNNRVVIPDKLKHRMLLQLHMSHLGVVKMKNIARSYFYWPGINKDIENLAKSCENCSVNKISPPKTELHPWKWPEEVFSRIHIDFMGPFLNKYFFIIVDSHSKWIEVFPTNNITTDFTVHALHSTFARFGLPKVIASDNARSFTSSNFKQFLEQYGIQHSTISPYFPQSNGAAENAVKIIKNSLKNFLGNNKNLDINSALNKFLFDYRNTKHSTTGVSPSMLMFGRDLRTRFSILKHENIENVKNKVLVEQKKQIKYFGGKDRQFKIGDKVIVKDYREVNKVTWIPAIVEKRIGKCTYIVRVPELKLTWKRHTNQILKSNVQSGLHDQDISLNTDTQDNTIPDNVVENVDYQIGLNNENIQPSCSTSSPASRPKRNVKPPDRLVY